MLPVTSTLPFSGCTGSTTVGEDPQGCGKYGLATFDARPLPDKLPPFSLWKSFDGASTLKQTDPEEQGRGQMDVAPLLVLPVPSRVQPVARAPEGGLWKQGLFGFCQEPELPPHAAVLPLPQRSNKNAKRARVVQFQESAESISITPYARKYGVHPRSFHFDREGRMLVEPGTRVPAGTNVRFVRSLKDYDSPRGCVESSPNLQSQPISAPSFHMHFGCQVPTMANQSFSPFAPVDPWIRCNL